MAVLAAIAVVVPHVVEGRQRQRMGVSYALPAGMTLASSVADADIIVLCLVESSRARVFPPEPWTLPPGNTDALLERPVVATEHTVKALEVLKGDRFMQAGSEYPIIQHAGSAEWRGDIVVVDGPYPAVFAPGEQYVLFVNWDETEAQMWAIPFETYKVEGGRIATSRKGPNEVAADGTNAGEFLAAIRALAARQ